MEIGGYLELELGKGKEYHSNAISLNTGRNALEYILLSKKYRKIYIPYFTCKVIMQPIRKHGIQAEYYHIDDSFRPIFDFSKIRENEVFLYTNYFGICDLQVSHVAEDCQNLIIDNSQAFFSQPLYAVDTFYSPRKFFGVPDGAYLYTNKILSHEFERDYSYERMGHLLGRIDGRAQDFYLLFKKNNSSLTNQPIKLMSNLTSRLLCSISYDAIKKKRLSNFQYLHDELGKKNILNLHSFEFGSPLVYPLLLENGAVVKEHLISRKIFIPTYWPNVLDLTSEKDMEYNLVNNLIALPIDQRYGLTEMKEILNVIQQ